MSSGPGVDRAVGSRPSEIQPRQLGPGREPELAEHVSQMEVDRARTEEQLRGDVPVGTPLGDQVGDLDLLGGQVVERARVAPATPLAARTELGAGALSPQRRSQGLEQIERGA